MPTQIQRRSHFSKYTRCKSKVSYLSQLFIHFLLLFVCFSHFHFFPFFFFVNVIWMRTYGILRALRQTVYKSASRQRLEVEAVPVHRGNALTRYWRVEVKLHYSPSDWHLAYSLFSNNFWGEIRGNVWYCNWIIPRADKCDLFLPWWRWKTWKVLK